MDKCKRCARCKLVLPASEFGRRAAASDGLHPYCKSCVREYCRARYKTHAEQIKTAVRDYRRRNAEQIQQRARDRYANDRDKYVKRIASYYRANSDRLRTYRQIRWTRRDAEAERAYKRKYRRSHKVLRREWEHRRRARERASMVMPLTKALIAAKVDYWGRKCWVCSGPFEALDHVKPIAVGGPHILANLRPICGSCNSKKNSTWPFTPPIRTEG